MRYALRNLGFLALGLFLVSTLPAQDKKDSKESSDHKDKLVKIPNEIYGKITGIDAQDKSISLLIGKKNEKVMTIDDLKVRMKNPPVVYDDKGKKKNLTAKEKKDLKGDDPKLPGYTAGFEDLKVNQVVQVSLVYKKSDKTKQPLASMILIVNNAN
jgi:hypothetical protein